MSAEPVDLTFKKYGSGPPLVILHGLLGAGGNWHTLSRGVFAEHFTVYAVDLRNHGRSPHAERFDLPAMVSDVSHFFDVHGLETGHLLGHSMGGKVAMHVALTLPVLVRRLVVVDIAPRAYPPTHTPIFEALQAVDFSIVDDRGDVDKQLARTIRSRRVRQFLMKSLGYDSDSNTYSWQMALDAIHANYDEINRAVESETTYDGATLFVRGEESDYIRDEDEADIRRLFPDARIVTVKGAGHWVHADAPEAFADVVLAFLLRE